jgi:CRISPR/Cas system-associated exonuclease Cas4 (RecB family)
MLGVFETCPFKWELKFERGLEEPKQENSPLERGSQIHEGIEKFIKGEIETLPTGTLPPEELGDYYARGAIETLREMYNPDAYKLEQFWYFSEAWEPVDRSQYFVSVLDLFYRSSVHPEYAKIFDWKTGKKASNIVKHVDQANIYALCTFLKFPDLEEIDVDFVYVDLNERLSTSYARERHVPSFLPKLEARIQKILDTKIFNPKPSQSHCRFCAYKTGMLFRTATPGTGDCAYNTA